MSIYMVAPDQMRPGIPFEAVRIYDFQNSKVVSANGKYAIFLDDFGGKGYMHDYRRLMNELRDQKICENVSSRIYFELFI